MAYARSQLMGSNEPSPAISPLPTQQRLGQARGRILLHDARCALGTDHALVERVIGIAVDVADLAVLQMHANAAATGAHVAGGDLDFALNSVFRSAKRAIVRARPRRANEVNLIQP
jgi:hypothetical protein